MTRPLTHREADVLRLAADGRTYAEIADELHIGTATVHGHLVHARQALGARNTVHAVAICFRLGVLGGTDADVAAARYARERGLRLAVVSRDAS